MWIMCDTDQIECQSLFVTSLDPTIERTIERPPALNCTLNCTHDSDRSHQFNGSLLKRPLKTIACMIKCPPALNHTCDCALVHTRLYVFPAF